jgi:hypothetical protein
MCLCLISDTVMAPAEALTSIFEIAILSSTKGICNQVLSPQKRITSIPIAGNIRGQSLASIWKFVIGQTLNDKCLHQIDISDHSEQCISPWSRTPRPLPCPEKQVLDGLHLAVREWACALRVIVGDQGCHEVSEISWGKGHTFEGHGGRRRWGRL